MKILFTLSTGNVLVRIPDLPFFPNLPTPIDPIPSDDQALITVPSSVVVPEAIVRVIAPSDSESSDYQFIIDQTLIDSQWASIKSLRSQKLRESDWICSVTDYTVSNKEEWITYRQNLRNLTQQPNPFQLVWPTEPSPAITYTSAVPAPSSTIN
jgi:hypothetical protein